jgi:hypothetical protein
MRSTFGELFETLEGDVKGIRVSKLCRIVLDRNIEDLDISVKSSERVSTLTILISKKRIDGFEDDK